MEYFQFLNIIVFILTIFRLIGLFFLVIGIFEVVQRRPFLIHNRWLIGIIILDFLPILIKTWLFSHNLDPIGLINSLTVVLVSINLFFFRSGYSAFGLTDVALREALHNVLEKRKLNFEETHGSIKLTSVQAELKVSVQRWIGIGMIRIKRYQQNQLLTEIVRDINVYFKENQKHTNVIACICYLFFAAFMIIISSYIYPLQADSYNFQAWQYAEQNKNLDDAMALVDRAIAYKPLQYFLDTKAEILYKMGKYQDAVNIETDLIRKYPHDQFYRAQLTKFEQKLNLKNQ